MNLEMVGIKLYSPNSCLDNQRPRLLLFLIPIRVSTSLNSWFRQFFKSKVQILGKGVWERPLDPHVQSNFQELVLEPIRSAVQNPTFRIGSKLDFIHLKLELFSTVSGSQLGSQTFSDMPCLIDMLKSLEKIQAVRAIAV